MHECSKVEDRLIDLIFGEFEESERSRILAEIESCSDCLNEYSSMTGALVAYDEAVEASLPDESYWPEHHEALRFRLKKFAHGAQAKKLAPFWKSLFTARLPVPVPIAAAIAIAFLIFSVFALRSSTSATSQAVASQPLIVTKAPPQYIEVPVIQEKVVTRIVYVEKKEGSKSEARRQSPSVPPTPNSPEKDDRPDDLSTPATLAGFQPPDEMRIRVIRRSNSDEN